MEDKKLNEVTKVTDMAYVPVIMADGSIGQIAKADLASVVAGLLGLDRFYVKSSITTSITTSIPVNADFHGSKAYLYLLSYHTNGGDATEFRFGVLKLGYSDNHITDYPIAGTDDSEIGSFAASEDGFVSLIVTSQPTPRRLILLG